jgi:hypothetical protein
MSEAPSDAAPSRSASAAATPESGPELLDAPAVRYRFLAAALLVVLGAAADVSDVSLAVAYGCLVGAVLITRGLPTDLPWRLYLAIVCGWLAASTGMRLADALPGTPDWPALVLTLFAVAGTALLRTRPPAPKVVLPETLQHSALPACLLDERGRVLAANDAFETRMALTLPLAGLDLSDVVTFADDAAATAWLARRTEAPLPLRSGSAGPDAELFLLPAPQGGHIAILADTAVTRLGELTALAEEAIASSTATVASASATALSRSSSVAPPVPFPACRSRIWWIRTMRCGSRTRCAGAQRSRCGKSRSPTSASSRPMVRKAVSTAASSQTARLAWPCASRGGQRPGDG